MEGLEGGGGVPNAPAQQAREGERGGVVIFPSNIDLINCVRRTSIFN